MTKWITFAWIVAIILYDVWAYRQYGPEGTVSATLREWSEQYPVLLIALGCLLWHLFGKEH
jgi:hypothetical protein